jgi:hypothetical protein
LYEFALGGLIQQKTFFFGIAIRLRLGCIAAQRSMLNVDSASGAAGVHVHRATCAPSIFPKRVTLKAQQVSLPKGQWCIAEIQSHASEGRSCAHVQSLSAQRCCSQFCVRQRAQTQATHNHRRALAVLLQKLTARLLEPTVLRDLLKPRLEWLGVQCQS